MSVGQGNGAVWGKRIQELHEGARGTTAENEAKAVACRLSRPPWAGELL